MEGRFVKNGFSLSLIYSYLIVVLYLLSSIYLQPLYGQNQRSPDDAPPLSDNFFQYLKDHLNAPETEFFAPHYYSDLDDEDRQKEDKDDQQEDEDHEAEQYAEEDILNILDDLDFYDYSHHQRIYTPSQTEDAQEDQRKDLLPRYSFLKKGTTLFEKQTDRPYQLQRDLYTKTLNISYGSDKSWVLNNDGEKKYWVYIEDVVNIENEYRLRPRHIGSQDFHPEKTNYRSLDDKLQLRHEFKFGVHLLSSRSIRSTFNPDLSLPSGNMVDYTIYPLWHIPLNLGWTARFEGTTSSEQLEGRTDQVSWLALSTGPKIRYEYSTKENYRIDLTAEVTQGFIFNGLYNQEGFEGDFLRFTAELRVHWQTRIGEVFLSGGWISERQNIDRQENLPMAAPGEGRTSSGFLSGIGLSFQTELGL